VTAVAFSGSVIVTAWAATGGTPPALPPSSVRTTTPAPAPPPMRAPATRPATPVRHRPVRWAGALTGAGCQSGGGVVVADGSCWSIWVPPPAQPFAARRPRSAGRLGAGWTAAVESLGRHAERRHAAGPVWTARAAG